MPNQSQLASTTHVIENWWLKSSHYPVSQSHTLHNISPRTVRNRTHITPWCYDSSPGHSRRSRKWQEQRSPAPWQSVARGSSRQIWQMDRKCLRLRLIKSFPLEMLSLAHLSNTTMDTGYNPLHDCICQVASSRSWLQFFNIGVCHENNTTSMGEGRLATALVTFKVFQSWLRTKGWSKSFMLRMWTLANICILHLCILRPCVCIK